MPLSEQRSTKLLRMSEIIYMCLTALSFYLLIMSRTGEARTVWQVLHPAFIPVLFVATFFLLAIMFSSEKTTNKMLFIIVYSIFIHSFFPIVFPAGDNSGQQMILGQIRRVFDNTIIHGLSGWPSQSLQIFLVEMFDGINLQAALSVIFARMLNVDIFYVHLFFVPVLWGVFIPIASFLTTKTLGGGEKASVLSSLLVSAFPYATYFGAISVPNSLGFIFFFYSLCFMLKYLASNDSKTAYLMVAFSLFSFLSHYLTGIMSFSFIFLAVVFKAYESEKRSPCVIPRASLIVSFFLCLSLLPMSFIYLRFVGSITPVFTIAKFQELPAEEIAGLLLVGELIYGFDLQTMLLVVIGPALGLLWMICLLYKLEKKPTAKFSTPILFLFAAFMVVLIDYRVLKLLMEGLPLNEERLWVFRDFIAVPFVALAICSAVSSVNKFLKARHPSAMFLTRLRNLSKRNVLYVLALLLTLNVLIPTVLAGWVTYSLRAAYPRIAPLQTTLYELEAVRHIEENTEEKYVVIGDVWTIFAGEVIVGIKNPRAYYFGEFNKTGYDLFLNMTQDPSPQWMLHAMNYTDTTTAYFIITEPRVGTEEYNRIVTEAGTRLPIYDVFGEGKLHIFYYTK